MLSDHEFSDINWGDKNPIYPNIYGETYLKCGIIGDGNCLFHAICKALSDPYLSTYELYGYITEGTLRKLETIIKTPKYFPSNIFSEARGNDLKKPYSIVGHKLFEELMFKYKYAHVTTFKRQLMYKIQNDSGVKILIKDIYKGIIDLKMSEGYTEAFAVEFVVKYLIEGLKNNNYSKSDIIPLISCILQIDIYLMRENDLTNKSKSKSKAKSTMLYGGIHLHAFVHGPKPMRRPQDPFESFDDRSSILILSTGDNHYELICKQTKDKVSNKKFKFDSDEVFVRVLYQELLEIKEDRIKRDELVL